MENVTTERLVVRRFGPADLEEYLAYQSLPEIRHYTGDEAMSVERATAMLARQAAVGDDEMGFYHAFAVEHRGDKRVIGDVGFFLASGPEEKGDLGFQFHPLYHGQGYATEAAEAALEIGFGQWGLRRITAGCHAGNTASYRVMERLGMRREAHFRQSRITQGELHDEYAYALLREEWLAR